jgi:hypothetical protein
VESETAREAPEMIHSKSELTTDFADGTDKKDGHSEGFVRESAKTPGEKY